MFESALSRLQVGWGCDAAGARCRHGRLVPHCEAADAARSVAYRQALKVAYQPARLGHDMPCGRETTSGRSV
jgi:hypothetical protein